MGFVGWLIAAVLLGLFELLTVDLTFLMLAGGALAASLLALFVPQANWYWTVGSFSLVSLALLFIVRPKLRKHLDQALPSLKTNASGLVGMNAVVLKTVDPRSGLVKLSGQEWSARSISEEIPVGRTVQVTAIDGATAVVTALPELSSVNVEGKEN